MSLKEKVIVGLKWSVISKLVVQLFSWVATFLIIRLLTPDDYGLVAIVSVLFTFITIFTVNGFVITLVKNQKIEKKTSSQLFTISFAVYLFFALVLSFFANDISNFYNDNRLENIIYLMALVTPVNSFCIIPNAVFSIEMNFKKKAICESITALGTTLVALTFAYTGFGYWSLIFANITGIIINVISVNMIQKTSYCFTSNLSGIKPLLLFATKIQFNELIWFIYNKLDAMIIGKYLGVHKLGIYNVAIEVASLPMTKVSSILNQVGLSAFSSINKDLSAAKYYLTKTLRMIALIAFPVFAGISIIADEVVLLLIGNKWGEAGPIITVFSLIFPFRMLNTVIGNFTIAMDEARFTVYTTLIISTFVIGAILIGVQFGLIATAFAWAIGFMFAFIIILIRVYLKFKLTWNSLFSWLPPLYISIVMWLILWQLEYLLDERLSLFELLAVKILVGVCFIMTVYYFLFKDEILNIIKPNSE